METTASVDGPDPQELKLLKDQLESLRKKRMDGVAIRSRVKWLNEGEKASKYFFWFRK